MSPERAEGLGPKRRRWMLPLWAGLLLAVLAAQRATARSFDHGYWEAGDLTDATQAELLWYRLPVAAIVVIAAVFILGLRWWVPEKPTRAAIRIWGILASCLSAIISIGMSMFFYLEFYMD